MNGFYVGFDHRRREESRLLNPVLLVRCADSGTYLAKYRQRGKSSQC
jgi:hypothetical protein